MNNFTLSELFHLEHCVKRWGGTGEYYGRKDYFDKRHKLILEKLAKMLELELNKNDNPLAEENVRQAADKGAEMQREMLEAMEVASSFLLGEIDNENHTDVTSSLVFLRRKLTEVLLDFRRREI